MERELVDERPVFLSTTPAGLGERRLAFAVVLVSIAIFLAAVPFAKLPLLPVAAFIPIYESALVINDLITAVLLFGQYRFLRSRALLVLASGYLFTAFMTVAHGLSFPGLFTPTGLLGAGLQTTAWLYMFWHGGFPLFVIAYALLGDLNAKPPDRPSGHVHITVLSAVAVILVTVCVLTLLVTIGHDAFPAIIINNRYTPAMIAVVSSVWVLSLLALIVLWRRRPHSLLDLWLMVVMCAWLFDIALSAVLNGGRYDLGFYAGRIYGLLAASFVLMVLLLENSRLYARLVELHASEHLKKIELAAVNKELEAFSYSVSHDLRAPLRSIDGFSRIVLDNCADKLDAQNVGYLQRARAASQRLGLLIDDMLELSRVARAELKYGRVDLSALVRLVADELRGAQPERSVTITIAPDVAAQGDARLLRVMLENLLSNALKFTGKSDHPQIEFGVMRGDTGERVYFVRDNGAGFDMNYADKLFGAFQRLHNADDFPGSGVGLASVQRIVRRHGGRVWAQGAVGHGATFYFML